MEQNHTIRYITLLLTFCAGFCDTATFISADELFSAHVTGNFIVFAYDVVHNADSQAWTKLLSFPVFVLSVATGGRLIAKAGNRYMILVAEAALITLCGLTALWLHFAGHLTSTWVFTIAMLLVFAMGLQNAFSRLFVKETFGPTTIMTGNVTQLALDLETGLRNGFAAEALSKQAFTLGGFLTGCLAGGILAQKMGLSAVLIPGILLGVLTICILPAGKVQVK